MSDDPPQWSEYRSEFERTGLPRMRVFVDANKSSTNPDERLLVAREWVRQQEDFKRDAREEESLSIAKETLAATKSQASAAALAATAAFEQARWAKWSAIIATVAAIVATIAAVTAIKG